MPRPLILALLLACLLSGAAPAAADPGVGVSPTAQGLTGTAKGLSPTAHKFDPSAGLSHGFDENLPVDIQGGRLSYHQGDETLVADGNVALASGAMTVHADRLWYDMKKGTLRAEGQVVIDQDGNTLWARKVELQSVTRTGSRNGTLEDLLYVRAPWSAACGGATLLPGDVIVLKGCECTSCREENPTWRLSADEIRVKSGDRMTAWGVWLYTGRMPVFYLPYFSQSLNDPRPPIEIKPGYTQALGAYVRTAYNFYVGDGQFGTVRYDWMDKLGNGYGAGEHYAVPGGGGSVAAYVVLSKTGATAGWSGNWTHKEDLGGGLTLSGNLDVLSNALFNQTYDLSQVDSYQQRSYLSLSSNQKTYNWTVQAGGTQVLQTVANSQGATVSQGMVTTQALLPSLSFSRRSAPVEPGSRLYWSLDGRLQHSLVAVQESLSPTGQLVYDSDAAYYMDDAALTPGLSYTFKLSRRLSLNSNVNSSLGYQHVDDRQPNLWDPHKPSYGLASFGGFVDLQDRPNAALTLDLGERYQRQLSGAQAYAWGGLITDRIEVKAKDQFSSTVDLLATEAWDLRPYSPDNDLLRLDPFRVQANWNPDPDHSSSLATTWDAYTQQFKTVDAWFNANDHLKRWQTNLGLNWVNNYLVMRQTSDPAVPQQLGWPSALNPAQLDQLLLSLRGTVNLGPKWRASYYERADLANRRLAEQALDLYRDFGCITVELYLRNTVFTGTEYGFSISLASVPGVSINSNQVTNDLFQQVQYGY
jgi:lipopolysaccharide export system protein LptA